MRKHANTKTPTVFRPRFAFVAIAVVTTLVAIWYWSGSRVELSEDGYQVAIALYRVCNQRSDSGLLKVESVWREMLRSRIPTNPSDRAIDEVIATAKVGQWEEASRLCRRALEDQVRRE